MKDKTLPSSTAVEPAEAVLYEIPGQKIQRYRRERIVLWQAFLGAEATVMALALMAVLDLNRWVGGEGVRVASGFVIAGGALGGVAVFYIRPSMLEINRVAVTETGIYPPFKPRRERRARDWFVPYSAIASIEPVDSTLEFLTFRVTLKDGLVFHLRTGDVLQYAGEEEARRFGAVLERALKEGLQT